MRLQIDSRVVGEVLVVKCRGRIVAGDEVQALHNHLKEATLETSDVVLQLGEVTFIDSSGLGMLVRLMAHARSRGGDLKLCTIPEPIFKSLRMTNLSTVFETYASEVEAITASYQRRGPKQTEALHPLQTVLCLEESPDVLAYLRELLRHAGYGVLTTSMVHDAKILLTATRPGLVVLGPRMGQMREKSTKDLVGEIAPTVPVFVLKEDFSTQDPGDAGLWLLEKVRHLLPVD
jgi:anti-sigma B factor antagonist